MSPSAGMGWQVFSSLHFGNATINVVPGYRCIRTGQGTHLTNFCDP